MCSLIHLATLGDDITADLNVLHGLVLHRERQVRAVAGDLQQCGLEVGRVWLVLKVRMGRVISVIDLISLDSDCKLCLVHSEFLSF